MQMQMYAHPKRHLPQTRTNRQYMQSRIHTHIEFLSITIGDGQRHMRSSNGDE